jgi:hypothetical protein
VDELSISFLEVSFKYVRVQGERKYTSTSVPLHFVLVSVLTLVGRYVGPPRIGLFESNVFSMSR